MEPVDYKLVLLALDEVDTASFERFGQAFYSAIAGKRFVALGGMHDGGAEGFVEPEVYEDNVSHFMQVSKQENISSKIRQTVRRLRDFGRVPASLTYFTSRTVEHIDREEEKLSDDLNCRIRIRDAKYIQNQINYSEATIQAFDSFLRPSVHFIMSPGSAPIANRMSLHGDRTLAVFLRQEVEHRRGKTDLLEAVADSLILWSLSDTDPDRNILLTRDEILTAIEAALPSAKQFIRGVIDHRLSKLHEKNEADGRQIRFHRKEGGYCLPYATRKIVSDENIEDGVLKIQVTDILTERAFECMAEEDDTDLVSYVVPICHSVLERIFEKQGLQVAQFAVDGEQDDELYANVADLIPIVIDEQDIPSELISSIRRVALQVLRKTFYDATPEERTYLEKLSRTYVLMLLLKNDAKIVEYFKSVSSNFKLYVGTDFIIRALSEHYLDPVNQSTVNLFKVLVEAGSTLILTEKTVEEVATHIRAQIFEFENTYSHLEHKIEFGYVEYIDRILIRSYFYARLAPLSSRKSPSGWRSYIEQFASYAAIRSHRGDEELARYLVSKFGFQYETTQEMESGVDSDEVIRLKEDILKVRSEFGPLKDSSDLLAYNDALQVLRVYCARRQGSESSPSNPFGFKTWWLTQDGKVRRASARVIRENNNHRFMMRPEFLLNFIAFAPSGREVETSYRTVFPSILGIRLSNRVRSDLFRKVMKDANEAWQVDEARSSAMVTELLDALKGDNLKVYENRMWENSD